MTRILSSYVRRSYRGCFQQFFQVKNANAMFVGKLLCLWCVKYQTRYTEFIGNVSKQTIFLVIHEKKTCLNFIGSGTFICLENVHHYEKGNV